MAWVEAVRGGSLDTLVAADRRVRDAATPARASEPAVVFACGCGGECRCGTMVPYLLQRQIELECEFFRDVH